MQRLVDLRPSTITANPRNVGTSWPKYWPQVAKILAPGCQNVGPSCPIFWPHHFYGGSLTFRKWVTHDGIQRLCVAGISNESLFTSIGALHASTSQKWVKFDTQHKVFCIPWFQSVAVAWRFIWRFRITSELVIDGLFLRVCWGLLVCPKMPTGALPSRYTPRASPRDNFSCNVAYHMWHYIIPKGTFTQIINDGSATQFEEKREK